MTLYAKVILVRHPLWLVEYASADRVQRGKLLRRYGSTITELVKLPAPAEFEDATEARQHVIIQGELLHLPQYCSIPTGFQMTIVELSETRYRHLSSKLQESPIL